jgi:hypothetical protein
MNRDELLNEIWEEMIALTPPHWKWLVLKAEKYSQEGDGRIIYSFDRLDGQRDGFIEPSMKLYDLGNKIFSDFEESQESFLRMNIYIKETNGSFECNVDFYRDRNEFDSIRSWS